MSQIGDDVLASLGFDTQGHVVDRTPSVEDSEAWSGYGGSILNAFMGMGDRYLRHRYGGEQPNVADVLPAREADRAALQTTNARQTSQFSLMGAMKKSKALVIGGVVVISFVVYKAFFAKSKKGK